MIDINNGNFKLSNDIVITNNDSFYNLNKIGLEKKMHDYNNGYKWIVFKNVLIESNYFHIGLCFKNDSLDYIDFGFSDESQLKDISWTNWSEQNELSKKELYEKWLSKNFGTKRKFTWGNIEAYYEPRGGTTAMVLRYKKTKT